jgi:small conductance mechanosensitive channel
LTQVAVANLTAFGLKLLGAVVVWLVGRRLISLAVRLTMSAVRPFCHDDAYWQVYFDTNRAIRETFAAAGYPAPQPLV